MFSACLQNVFLVFLSVVIESVCHCLNSLVWSYVGLDLIYFFCYRIIFCLVDINCDNFFEIRSCTVTRGHPYKIFKHHCPSSTRSSFFSERVFDIWNGLSSHHTDFSSLPRFRRCINTIDFSDYLEFVWLQILFLILISVWCIVFVWF